jgi:pimeloyl-ACP methyl ester carboxylesterase
MSTTAGAKVVMESPRCSTVASTDGTTIGYHTLGSGPGVVVVGGALRSGEDYLPLGRALAGSRTAHLMDRRGRGASGPQGSDYSIDRECEDLRAVIAATDADAIFGHSYGGLIALESARRERSFPDVIVYEPGVSVHGSLPLGWLARYRELLDRGDARGAFTCMVRQAGFAPAMLSRMPSWCARAILALVVRGQQWQAMKALLRTHLLEGEQAALLDGDASRFSTIDSRVLLLAGAKSPASITMGPMLAIQAVIAGSTFELMQGLGHTAPDDQAPQRVAERVLQFSRS